MVTIIEDGVKRRVTAAEGFVWHVTKKGIETGGAAALLSMAALEAARTSRAERGIGLEMLEAIRHRLVTPGSVYTALEPLRMATKLDPQRRSVRVMLEPWIVQQALARFGSRTLTPDQQATVVNSTRARRRCDGPLGGHTGPWEK